MEEDSSSRATCSSLETRASSGFKYPRRLCTQKAEKYVDMYGQRPMLSPVRTRSQTHEPGNSENLKPSKSNVLKDIDTVEDGPVPPDSPFHNTPEVSTSTPKRRTSHRFSYDDTNDEESFDRSRSRLGSPSSSFSLDGSRISSGSERIRKRGRRRHPDYDPTIEIRQAKERHSKYRSGKWSDTSDLFDAVMEDKERYKEKLERRARNKGLIDAEGNPEVDMEEDDEVLARRQRDIDNGKTTIEYEGYVKAIPKPLRRINQPRTPNKFIKYSRRQWDGLVRSWRRQLHTWESDSAAESASSFSSYWDSPSFYSERDSFKNARVSWSGGSGRRTSFKAERRSMRSPMKAVNFPVMPPPARMVDGNVYQDDDDTMMGFPGQIENNPNLSSTPTFRKKRASGHGNGNSNGPELEALSTGLTSDVGDVFLNARGTPTKRKTVEKYSEIDNQENGGTPRKRARQQLTNSDQQSFAQVVRGGGSPYKLRSQIRKTSTIDEEEINPAVMPSGTRVSYAQAAGGTTCTLDFDGDS